MRRRSHHPCAAATSHPSGAEFSARDVEWRTAFDALLREHLLAAEKRRVHHA
jgi:hypothetical protein